MRDIGYTCLPDTANNCTISYMAYTRNRLVGTYYGADEEYGTWVTMPGLGTTATRVGARLTIQNDIGATEVHVLVVHVEGSAATVTDPPRRLSTAPVPPAGGRCSWQCWPCWAG